MHSIVAIRFQLIVSFIIVISSFLWCLTSFTYYLFDGYSLWRWIVDLSLVLFSIGVTLEIFKKYREKYPL